MATTNSDGSIILNTKVDTSGLKKGMSSIATGAKKMASTVGKAFLAIGAAATAATVAIAKASVDAYAEYEQLVGGVETLFKGSSKKLIEYANEAYKTAGVSANEYMSIVTSFSASLLQSLGGDTDKAADIANQALIDMSDNANKMGTSMESIQNAYQGFAKQNYTMLDNLKLGYGGTKTEMERLLKDAQALTGVEYDVSNLSDVYKAIHVIQENLGIAGTTALEAEKTISGSAATMKAAWQNVLTAISGGGDLDKAIENLVDSVSTYFENIVPVVERALSGIGTLIEKVAPMLVQTVAKSLIKAIPSLLNALYEMIIGLAKGIYQGIIDLFSETAIEALTEQAEIIEQSVENQNDLTEAVKETNAATKKMIAGFDEIQILASYSSEESSVADALGAIVPSEETAEALSDMETSVKGFAKKVLNYFKPLLIWIKKSFIQDGIGGLVNGFNDLRSSLSVLEEPLSRFWNNTLSPIVSDLGLFVTNIVSDIGNVFSYVGKKTEEYRDEISAVINGISVAVSVLWSFFKPIITSVIEFIGNALKKTTDFVMSIISVLSNLFSFVENIFKGIVESFKGNTDSANEYFKNAMVGFVNIFVSIGNAIIDILNACWEAIFSGVKGFVNGLGGLVGKIGDLIGQEDWGWNWNAEAPSIPHIPKWIPKLAQGAVIPGNREFLAVLGDQPAGQTNIEAPLQTIVDAFNIALAQNGGASGGNIEVILEIDGREFGRAVVEHGNKESRRIGTRLVIA